MYAKFSNIVQNITQKNRLIATVVLSTHNVCFGWEIRKLFFNYALLTGGMFFKLSYAFEAHYLCYDWYGRQLRSSLIEKGRSFHN